MSKISVTSMGPHEYGVELSEGGDTGSQHHHKVTVPTELLERWGVDADREEAVVRESMAFLLEREPASSIMKEFSLSVISRYFPEYEDELPKRLS